MIEAKRTPLFDLAGKRVDLGVAAPCAGVQLMGVVQLPPTVLSPVKEEIRRWSDATASQRAQWRRRAAFFHSEDLQYLKFLIPEGTRVLELGCSTGQLLAAL